MTARDVRDAVTDAYESILRRTEFTGATGNLHAVALELIAAAEGRGVRFTAPAHHDDPAADWTQPVRAAPPSDDWHAARAALATTEPEKP